MRSFCFLVELSTVVPVFRVPEYTRTKDRRPTKGSVAILNAKAEKDLRGSVNRRVNCDAHNLDKAVDAAQEQIEAIYTLEQRGMLAELPDKLKEAVDLRMAHPEMTLSQLCTLCDPPVSKSALNHRLRKLLGLAKR